MDPRKPQDRLQPALLDRLIDDAPHERTREAPERRAIDRARLREAVLRDLAWLFGAARPAARDGLDGWPHARGSVLNYGLPALAGATLASLDAVAIERAIRQAIIDYEPRILAHSVEVAPLEPEARPERQNVVRIRIRGLLWAQPVPLELLLRTDLDLETGRVEISDLARGR